MTLNKRNMRNNDIEDLKNLDLNEDVYGPPMPDVFGTPPIYGPPPPEISTNYDRHGCVYGPPVPRPKKIAKVLIVIGAVVGAIIAFLLSACQSRNANDNTECVYGPPPVENEVDSSTTQDSIGCQNVVDPVI